MQRMSWRYNVGDHSKCGTFPFAIKPLSIPNRQTTFYPNAWWSRWQHSMFLFQPSFPRCFRQLCISTQWSHTASVNPKRTIILSSVHCKTQAAIGKNAYYYIFYPIFFFFHVWFNHTQPNEWIHQTANEDPEAISRRSYSICYILHNSVHFILHGPEYIKRAPYFHDLPICSRWQLVAYLHKNATICHQDEHQDECQVLPFF